MNSSFDILLSMHRAGGVLDLVRDVAFPTANILDWNLLYNTPNAAVAKSSHTSSYLNQSYTGNLWILYINSICEASEFLCKRVIPFFRGSIPKRIKTQKCVLLWEIGHGHAHRALSRPHIGSNESVIYWISVPRVFFYFVFVNELKFNRQPPTKKSHLTWN